MRVLLKALQFFIRANSGPGNLRVMTSTQPVVISGPSGSGKSTLLQKLFGEFPGCFEFSVSHTTRKPREGEMEGKDYYFVERTVFENMVSEGGFLEHAQFSGNCYGTSYGMWRVMSGLHTELEYSLMEAGHTKFSPDWHFGLWKVRWRHSTAETLSDISSTVKESSRGGHNIPQLVNDPGRPVVFYDWATFLKQFFKPVPHLKKYHHFSKMAVEKVQSSGKICILDVEINGVKNIKQTDLNAKYVFVQPPSIESLEKRLRGRGTETEESLKKRLDTAQEALDYAQEPRAYDHIIVNDDLEVAYEKLKGLLSVDFKILHQNGK